MELPQPRPIGTEGKKPTHDFLSLYTHSSFQDPRPSQGNFLRTHDFLQPLERVGKKSTRAEKTIEKNDIEKPPPPSTSSSTSVEHILPGGIGTYTIRHISNFNQRAPKTEQSVYALVRPEKSNEVIKPNSSSNSVGAGAGAGAGAFTIWEESTSKEKGATAKHPRVERQVMRETAGENLGHWSSDRSLQTPPFVHRNTTNTNTNNSNSNSSSFNCRSSSKTKNQSFMEMMKSGRGLQEDEDEDDDEFLSKKSHSSSNNKEEKSGQPRANTPRSKHSATEQRRRSKINDRFQILRDLIPQNDQKRDKASFLLEVIDYIKYLQEKVNRYETSYQGWNQEPTKLTPWRNGHAPVDTIIDPSQAINSVPVPTLVFSGKFDDNNIPANPTMLIGAQNPVEPDLSPSSAIKAIEQHAGLANKGVPIPISAHTVPPFGRNCGLAQAPQQPMPDSENMASQPPSHLWQGVLCADECPMTSDVLNEQEELTIEGGTISIAGAYSQGLLNNLTQALQSSGVDLSHASISVQVDIGKRAINRLTTMASGAAKDHEDPGSERAMTHSRFGSSGEDSDHARKRPRIE